jgi:hypothetical protein
MSEFTPLREAVDTLASRAPSPDFGELKRRASRRGRRRAAIAAVAAFAVITGSALAATDLIVTDGTGPVSEPGLTGQPLTPSATPTPTPTIGASLTLRGDGIGPFTFGANQVDVDAALSARLGDPEVVEQGILCSMEGSPWSQIVNYARPDRAVASISPASGGLLVFYTAKDQSEQSPRSLAYWGFPLEQQLPAPLAMQDDVPLNLTFNQLKAKYPAGKLEYGDLDEVGRDQSLTFTLPNKLQFIANPAASKPSGVWAGQGVPCP